MKKQVSCIIPAYNEQKTIAGVIKVCLKTPEIKEITVVNDGSKDKTEKIVKRFKKVKLINLPENKGKGYAVVKGIKAAKQKYLIFVDADLVNIKPYHLSSLIRPVINKEVDMTIADFRNGIFRPHSNLWPFNGQRCLSKRVIKPLLKEIGKAGYGLEIILNERLKHKKVVVVPLITYKKEFHTIKPKKQKDWLVSYIREVREVTETVLKNRSKSYRLKAKTWLTENLADYLKVSVKKIKEYLNE